jgi:hypothetical protein
MPTAVTQKQSHNPTKNLTATWNMFLQNNLICAEIPTHYIYF